MLSMRACYRLGNERCVCVCICVCVRVRVCACVCPLPWSYSVANEGYSCEARPHQGTYQCYCPDPLRAHTHTRTHTQQARKTPEARPRYGALRAQQYCSCFTVEAE